MARVRMAGTTLARSSTKSICPVSIFSSRQARTSSVHHRGPAADRGGGQVGVERLAVVPLLGRVHLEEPALDLHALRGGDGDALVAAPLVVHVVVVGQVFGRAGELEDLAVAGRDPVAAVGVAPGDGALGVHLLGDRLELVAVLRGVPVEVIPVLLAVGVVEDFLRSCRPSFRDRDGLLGARADGLGHLGLLVGRDVFADGARNGRRPHRARIPSGRSWRRACDPGSAPGRPDLHG